MGLNLNHVSHVLREVYDIYYTVWVLVEKNLIKYPYILIFYDTKTEIEFLFIFKKIWASYHIIIVIYGSINHITCLTFKSNI